MMGTRIKFSLEAAYKDERRTWPRTEHIRCAEARAWIILNLLDKDRLFKLSKEEIETICCWTEGYSGSDMKNLVKDASIGPLREALRQGIVKDASMGPLRMLL
uniref:AAA ATPase AAA+ lid domain-containing protein n=1 Tax=Quercus lobata TaxID=97700 RepID=A0A7N2LKX7_QUELO